MKIVKHIFLTILMPLFIGTGATWAQGSPRLEEQEVRGTVQLWAPAAQRIEVGGRSYLVARDVQVVDGQTRLLPPNRVRPGSPVLLLISGGGLVTHVVVNPGNSSPFDKAGR